MRRNSSLLGLLLAASLGLAVSHAQASTVLSTSYVENNSNNGEVFQLQAINAVTITGFGVDLTGNITGYTIYEHVGAFSSVQAGSSPWTVIATGGAVTSNGTGFETALPSTFSVSLAAGGTDAFLILTSGSGQLVAYENGGSLGTTLASNTDLRILEGWGETNSFGTTNADREANVSVIYSAVPEPSTWAMMILGFFGVGFMAYRRRNSAVLSA
jgi:hypothetical protein